MRTIPLLALALAVSPALAGDMGVGEERDAHPAHEHGGEAPGKVPLFDDLGAHTHPVSTSSALAQRYFDQGLRFVYAFNHEEARRAFAEAARIDPELAMAHWGVALALGPNINAPLGAARERAAHEAVARGLALAENASSRERDYLRALAVRYAPEPGGEHDRRARDEAYAEAMRALAEACPEDLDAATLAAEARMDLRPWRLWTRDGEPAPGTREIVATLESVLARDPEHLGANHYYIHAVEASPHPERALRSAERLGDLAPGAGHLVHMPSHIFMRLGRYAEASDANARAAAADRAYLDRARPEGIYPMMYYPHNLHFLSVSAAFEGRREVSLRAARDAAAASPDAMVEHMPMLESFRAAPLLSMLRFEDWEALLAEPSPPEAQRYTTAIHLFARGVALARLDRAAEAEAEQACFEAARARVPGELSLVGNNLAPDVLAVAASILEGEIARSRGDVDGAIAALGAAAEAEDALAYGEPPDWPVPARHMLGAVLLGTLRAAEAERVFREDLRRHPENGWALEGLEESLRLLGRDAEADQARARRERAFVRSDLPRRGISGHRCAADGLQCAARGE